MVKSNSLLIRELILKGYLKNPRLIEALKKYKREMFVPDEVKAFAYEDVPLSIGYKQTISQPSTVMIMIEALGISKGDKILEIGTGSGWNAALISYLVGSNRNVYTIERIPELVKFAKNNIKRTEIKNIKVIEGDGSKGLNRYKHYDRCIVTAASPDILQPLVDQLKTGGLMIIPIGDYDLQDLVLVEKISKTKIKKKNLGKFRFVALLGRYGFQKKD